MELLTEILVKILWDLVKTVALQWIMDKIQAWWAEFSNSRKLAFA